MIFRFKETRLTTETEQGAILALARFGALCLREHREDTGDLDGGCLQETAVSLGLLEMRHMDAPCGGGCECWGFPTDCLFATEAIAKLLAPGALKRAVGTI